MPMITQENKGFELMNIKFRDNISILQIHIPYFHATRCSLKHGNHCSCSLSSFKTCNAVHKPLNLGGKTKQPKSTLNQYEKGSVYILKIKATDRFIVPNTPVSTITMYVFLKTNHIMLCIVQVA